MNYSQEEKEYNLNILNNFIGYGNPHSDYWFMGIEEGGNCWEDHDFEDAGLFNCYVKLFHENNDNSYFISKETLCDSPNSGYSPIYGKIRIALGLSHWTDYIENIFALNIYALPKPRLNANYSDSYLKNFGIKNQEEYVKKYKNVRVKILKSFIQKYFFNRNKEHNKYLICHGSSAFNSYIEFFKENFNIELDNEKPTKINNSKIFLMSHLSRRNNSGHILKKLLDIN